MVLGSDGSATFWLGAFDVQRDVGIAGGGVDEYARWISSIHSWSWSGSSGTTGRVLDLLDGIQRVGQGLGKIGARPLGHPSNSNASAFNCSIFIAHLSNASFTSAMLGRAGDKQASLKLSMARRTLNLANSEYGSSKT